MNHILITWHFIRGFDDLPFIMYSISLLLYLITKMKYQYIFSLLLFVIVPTKETMISWTSIQIWQMQLNVEDIRYINKINYPYNYDKPKCVFKQLKQQYKDRFRQFRHFLFLAYIFSEHALIHIVAYVQGFIEQVYLSISINSLTNLNQGCHNKMIQRLSNDKNICNKSK